jgi:hypothetical protein
MFFLILECYDRFHLLDVINRVTVREPINEGVPINDVEKYHSSHT